MTRRPHWYATSSGWLVFALTIAIGGTFVFFAWFRPNYLQDRAEHDTVTAPPAGITQLPAPTAEPEPTLEPVTTRTPKRSPTPSTKPSPTPVVRWISIDARRACRWGAPKPSGSVSVKRTTATSIGCTQTIAGTQSLGATEADVIIALSERACDHQPVSFDATTRIWYCQQGQAPHELIPVNWEQLCGGPHAYHDVDTTRPSCTASTATQFTLKVGNRSGQLGAYCTERGYDASVSGQNPDAPRRQTRPYCKDQS